MFLRFADLQLHITCTIWNWFMSGKVPTLVPTWLTTGVQYWSWASDPWYTGCADLYSKCTELCRYDYGLFMAIYCLPLYDIMNTSKKSTTHACCPLYNVRSIKWIFIFYPLPDSGFYCVQWWSSHSHFVMLHNTPLKANDKLYRLGAWLPVIIMTRCSSTNYNIYTVRTFACKFCWWIV